MWSLVANVTFYGITGQFGSVLLFLLDSSLKFQSCNRVFVFFDTCPKVIEIS